MRMEQLLGMQVSKCSRLQKFWVNKDLQNQIVGIEDHDDNCNDLMTNFCGVITVRLALLSYVSKID